jgi:TetR/AcrR family transcriptional regulator, fatty acid metabolism regulator protein
MSEAETQQQRGSSQKRRKILDGALRAFARKGFYGTKVSEIAQEAGVADGTIYLYFRNKDDLLISLFEDRMEWIIERIKTELRRVDGGVFEKIRCVVDLHFRLVQEEPELAEFITVELRQSAKFVKEYQNLRFYDYLGIFQEMIEEGQEQGLVRSDIDSRLVSRAMFGAMDEVLLQLTLSRTTAQVDAKVAQVADMFIDGIATRSNKSDTDQGVLV